MDIELVNAFRVKGQNEALQTFFANAAFGRSSVPVSTDSVALKPPTTPAGAVECFLPLAVPKCRLDAYGAGIIDIDLVLNSSGWDDSVWGSQPSPMDKSLVDADGSFGNTFEGAIIVFDEGGVDCDSVTYNQDYPVVSFYKAAIYDVRTAGSASDKNIKVRIDTVNTISLGTKGGGTPEDGIQYQPPPRIVR